MQSYGERDGLLLAAGLGLGATVMFLLDPSEGRRRRARTLRAISRVVQVAGGVAGSGARELRHRGERVATRVGSTLAEPLPPDAEIAELVRAVVTRSVSYPRSITVTVEEGRVILGGPIIAREVEGLLSRVRKLRGVVGVRSGLEAHDWAADVPGLQGAAERPRGTRGKALLESGWPTGVKLVGGAALGALALRRARSLR